MNSIIIPVPVRARVGTDPLVPVYARRCATRAVSPPPAPATSTAVQARGRAVAALPTGVLRDGVCSSPGGRR